jgi:hypothetical protein
MEQWSEMLKEPIHFPKSWVSRIVVVLTGEGGGGGTMSPLVVFIMEYEDSLMK